MGTGHLEPCKESFSNSHSCSETASQEKQDLTQALKDKRVWIDRSESHSGGKTALANAWGEQSEQNQ